MCRSRCLQYPTRSLPYIHLSLFPSQLIFSFSFPLLSNPLSFINPSLFPSPLLLPSLLPSLSFSNSFFLSSTLLSFLLSYLASHSPYGLIIEIFQFQMSHPNYYLQLTNYRIVQLMTRYILDIRIRLDQLLLLLNMEHLKSQTHIYLPVLG